MINKIPFLFALLLPAAAAETSDLLYLHEELQLNIAHILAAAPPAAAQETLPRGGSLSATAGKADAEKSEEATPEREAEPAPTDVPEVDAPVMTLIGVSAAAARRRRAA